MKSILEVVHECDNFPYYEPWHTDDCNRELESLWLFFLPDDPQPHGFLLDSIVQRMPWTSDFRLITTPYKEVHLIKQDLDDWKEACQKAIDDLLDLTREKKVFPGLGKKRDEQFPIFWVPRRNAKKSTWPNMLDNTVAGGVARGEMPFECLVREAGEEAALSEELVRRDTVAVGTVTWFNISDEKAGGELGLMNPGMLYVYDLEVGEDVVFKPVDNDVQSFHLLGVDEVKEAMRNGEFKPSCATVMIDFL
ncbi:hypothetical protein VC83_09569 [Pseudogymnoascus destructans]|uniref:Nudix hydrolase domain-containing protein n=1 Tax=Pseudogymnoascus destructans TaxID=655981 RepID=A0A176ZWC1_9PEZI|nr:uncharacterized protein VC83_09569 [Pseudogymnoascus destructans]OAF54209.1 hypothetical protein VC83_09569 [Pseudogymnoascus destructans]